MRQKFAKVMFTTLGLTLTLASPSAADQSVSGTVQDHFKTSYRMQEVVRRQCHNVEVPIYETRQRQGDAAGSALLGMIIGGAVGKGVTGDDKGAAAGAIMGGVIGADKGSRPRTSQVIVGYRQERQCGDEIVRENVPQEVYSHSTIRFTVNGRTYVTRFNK